MREHEEISMLFNVNEGTKGNEVEGPPLETILVWVSTKFIHSFPFIFIKQIAVP